MNTFDPLKVQRGGEHYKKMGIQPFEFSMANRWDACAHTALKYVARFRDKGTPLLDLEKAYHCIQIRAATIALALEPSVKGGKPAGDWQWRMMIPIERFIKSNEINDPTQAQALRSISDVVTMGSLNPLMYDECYRRISMLIQEVKASQHAELMHVATPGD